MNNIQNYIQLLSSRVHHENEGFNKKKKNQVFNCGVREITQTAQMLSSLGLSLTTEVETLTLYLIFN